MRFRSIFLGKNKISRRTNFSKLPYDTVCTANERFSQNLQPQNRKNHMAAIIEEEKSFPGVRLISDLILNIELIINVLGLH